MTNGHEHPDAVGIELPDEPGHLISPPFDEASLREPVWMAYSFDNKTIGAVRATSGELAMARATELYRENVASVRRVR